MATVFLALGTNLGEREANLAAARAHLPPEITVTAASPIYLTEPWGYTDQPDFLNQVLAARTELLPIGLLRRLKAIEAAVGRQPTFHYGPRLIDLDLLFYDSLVIRQAGLEVPHPRMLERAFVLRPLADIAPDLVHPVVHQSIAQLFEALPGSEREQVRRWTPGSNRE
jgi:2-amino-4-hydroxy-6-hydroxymethyldihydropteridine diphosphokinase